MARLGDIKSAVVGAATGYNPTMDFPVPDPLLNYIIITSAVNALYNDARSRRSTIMAEPWMATSYCLTPVSVSDDCVEACVTHSADLPFTPIDLPGGDGIMYARIKNGVKISINSKVLFGMAKSGFMYPSYDNPMAYVDNGKMYFSGGARDFSKCQVIVYAVAMDGVGECSLPDSTIVPIPDTLVSDVINLCVQKIAGTYELKDSYEEGNQEPKTPSQ